MNEETLFTFPAQITKVSSMSRRSMRLVVDSQEGCSDAQLARAMAIVEKVGHFTFSVEPIQPESILILPPLKWDKGEKSCAQTFRGVLFVWWTQLGKPMDSFELFYKVEFEKIINHYKEKLT